MKDNKQLREAFDNSSGNDSSPSTTVSKALELGKLGIAIFPIHGMKDGQCTCGGRIKNCRPGKHPLVRYPSAAATTDEVEIRKLWRDHPFANIAVPTGRRFGVFVLDVDIDKGGLESLRKLEERYGKLPLTWMVRTGSGGKHYYFLYPDGETIRNSSGKLGPGLDVRGEGGYVVGPGSEHKNGGLYVWEASPLNVSIAASPAFLLELICAPQKQKKCKERSRSEELECFDQLIEEGVRNDTLFRRYACFLKDRWLHKNLVTEWCLLLNSQRCDPPLPKAEVYDIVASAFRQPKRKCRKVGLSPGSKKVHQFIAERAGESGAWQGTIGEISTQVRISPRHTKRCIRQLEFFKFLEVQGNLGKASRYHVKDPSSVVFCHRGDIGVSSVQWGVQGFKYMEENRLKELKMSKQISSQEESQSSFTDSSHQERTEGRSRPETASSQSQNERRCLGGLIVQRVREGLTDSENLISTVPAVVNEIIQNHIWRSFRDTEGNVIRFDSFQQFTEEYLKSSVQSLREICHSTPEVLSLIDKCSECSELPAGATKGELFERRLLICQLRKALQWYGWRKYKFHRWVAYVIETETWKDFIDPTSGTRCKFRSFQEFVESHRFGGLGSSVEALRSYCAVSEEALELIEQLIPKEASGDASEARQGEEPKATHGADACSDESERAGQENLPDWTASKSESGRPKKSLETPLDGADAYFSGFDGNSFEKPDSLGYRHRRTPRTASELVFHERTAGSLGLPQCTSESPDNYRRPYWSKSERNLGLPGLTHGLMGVVPTMASHPARPVRSAPDTIEREARLGPCLSNTAGRAESWHHPPSPGRARGP